MPLSGLAEPRLRSIPLAIRGWFHRADDLLFGVRDRKISDLLSCLFNVALYFYSLDKYFLASLTDELIFCLEGLEDFSAG